MTVYLGLLEQLELFRSQGLGLRRLIPWAVVGPGVAKLGERAVVGSDCLHIGVGDDDPVLARECAVACHRVDVWKQCLEVVSDGVDVRAQGDWVEPPCPGLVQPWVALGGSVPTRAHGKCNKIK